MEITVFKRGILLLFVLLLAVSGCALFREKEVTLTALQKTVRQRLWALQVSEFLSGTAKERFQPGKAAEIFALGTGYQAGGQTVSSDPALQILEDAVSYGLTVLAFDPKKTAEKLIAARLDLTTLCCLIDLQKKDPRSLRDHTAELAMMTGREPEQIKKIASSIRLTVEDVPLFPISSAAERLLDEKGNKAAFDLAAEIYRHVDEGKLRNAERLRRAILNRYLMQIKSSGTRKIPELSIASQRGKLFAEFFKEL